MDILTVKVNVGGTYTSLGEIMQSWGILRYDLTNSPNGTREFLEQNILQVQERLVQILSFFIQEGFLEIDTVIETVESLLDKISYNVYAYPDVRVQVREIIDNNLHILQEAKEYAELRRSITIYKR